MIAAVPVEKVPIITLLARIGETVPAERDLRECGGIRGSGRFRGSRGKLRLADAGAAVSIGNVPVIALFRGNAHGVPAHRLTNGWFPVAEITQLLLA